MLIKSKNVDKHAYAFINNVVYNSEGVYFISFYGDPQYCKALSSMLVQRNKNIDIVDSDSEETVLFQDIKLYSKKNRIKTKILDNQVQQIIIYNHLLELNQEEREFVVLLSVDENVDSNLSDILFHRIDQISNIPFHISWKDILCGIFYDNNWLIELDSLDSTIKAYLVKTPDDEEILSNLKQMDILYQLIPEEDIIDCHVDNNIFESEIEPDNDDDNQISLEPLNQKTTRFLLNILSPLLQKENGEEIVYGSEFKKNREIMDLHVSRQNTVKKGQIYRIAHYYYQNLDCMSDPEYEILVDKKGNCYPITFAMSSLGVYQECCDFGYDDQNNWDILSFQNLQLYNDMKTGIKEWVQNLEQQFSIKNLDN